MKKALLSVSFFWVSVTVLADSSVNTVRTRLCDYWKYDFNSSSYSCSWLTNTVNLVEASRHDETVSKLETRIAELEKRLEALEKN